MFSPGASRLSSQRIAASRFMVTSKRQNEQNRLQRKLPTAIHHLEGFRPEQHAFFSAACCVS